MSKAFTPEGHRIPGAGIKVTKVPHTQMIHISVEYEDYYTNPLVHAWVKALARMADNAQWEIEHKELRG